MIGNLQNVMLELVWEPSILNTNSPRFSGSNRDKKSCRPETRSSRQPFNCALSEQLCKIGFGG